MQRSRPLRSEQARRALIGCRSVLHSRRDQFVALAARHAIPAIYQLREFAEPAA